MKILNHRLCDDDGDALPYVESPNRGGALDHRFLVIHYTAGRSAESSIRWFTNPQAKASAHLVIGRDGEITQQVPFNRVAWHAGRSRWKGLSGLNAFSLGIELDNAGRLKKVGENRWLAWFGGEYTDAEVLEAVHKNELHPFGWHLYTAEQIEATVEVSALLVEKYGLLDVIGHEDIAPSRKSDPGPAFPMESFRSRVLGRREDEEEIFTATANLNIRLGPGIEHPKLPLSPLAEGTRMVVQQTHGNWRFVAVLDLIDDGAADTEGWVHGNFLLLV